MMRFVRQILGCSEREARADALMRTHDEKMAPVRQEIDGKVAAIEKLVRNLQRETTKWH